MSKFIIYIVAVIGSLLLQGATPTWSVNPSDYSNSMVMVGVISLDGSESVDVNDMVAAFIGSEVRGVAQLQYEESIDRYVAFLIIYGNASNQTLTFKVYDASADVEVTIDRTAIFTINGLEGNLADPYKWSNAALSNAADLMSFTFASALSSGTISAGSVAITVANGTNVSSLAPVFSVSDGAVMKVNGQVQTSGITTQNFSSPVTYQVVSESGVITQEFVVTVTVQPSGLSNASLMTVFVIPEAEGLGTIGSNSVAITVPTQTDVTGLKATFSVSSGATVKVNDVLQVSGNTPNDFTNPVTYRVMAENGADFTDYVVTVTIKPEVLLGIRDAEQEWKVFPNPATHYIQLKHQSGQHLQSVSIMDSSGKLIHRIENPNERIGIEYLDKGLYLIQVDNGEEVSVARFIKK